jgi:hypothetical protein
MSAKPSSSVVKLFANKLSIPAVRIDLHEFRELVEHLSVSILIGYWFLAHTNVRQFKHPCGCTM